MDDPADITAEIERRLADSGGRYLVLPPMTLTYIPCPLPPTLEIIYCDEARQLTTLPDPLPPALKTLSCWGVPITVIPALPPTLEHLHCGSTRITQLPPLPPALATLSCCNTPLATLPPSLPPTLEALYCSSTQITTLPPLPLSLIHLCCDYTQIIALNLQGTSITYLRCGGPAIKEITVFPPTLMKFECVCAPLLTTLPPIPPTVYKMFIHNTPLLIKPDSELVFEEAAVSAYNDKWLAFYTRPGRALKAELAACFIRGQ